MHNHKTEPDLGSLEFQNIEGMLSYNCKMILPVSTNQVEIFFETNSEDRPPSAAQKQFLQHLVDNYNKVLHSLATEIPTEMEVGGINQFDLDTLGIPLNVENNPKWDLSLKSRSDKSISLLANFNGMTLIKVWVENRPKQPFFLRMFLKIIGK